MLKLIKRNKILCLVSIFLISKGSADVYEEVLFNDVSTFAQTNLTSGDGVSVDPNGNVFISGGPNGNIIKVSFDGDVSEFAKGFSSINGSDFDSKGNLYAAAYRNNQVIRFTPDGQYTVFADNLDGPAGLAIDKFDNVIVSLYGKGFSGRGATVLKISPDGEQTILAQNQGLKDVIGVAIDENNVVYVGNNRDRNLFSIKDSIVTKVAKSEVKINMIDYHKGYIYIPGDQMIFRIGVDGESEIFSGGYSMTQEDGDIDHATFFDLSSLAFNDDGTILYAYDKSSTPILKII